MALSENEKQSLNDLIDTALAGWTEEQWCQGRFARTSRSNTTNALNPRARQWCLIGRLCRAAGVSNLVYTKDGDLVWQIVNRGVVVEDDMEQWNDTKGRTFAEVRETLLSLKEPA